MSTDEVFESVRDAIEPSPAEAAHIVTEGLPMRVVVHSGAIQDRDGAGLMLDKNTMALPLARIDLGRCRLQRLAS